MRIANLSTKSGSMSSSDKFVTDNGTTVTKIDYNALAKAIIEQYTGSSLAGSAQSVKAALDSLNSKFSYATGATTQEITFRSSGAGFLVLTYGTNANLYFFNATSSTVYIKALVEQISNVSVSRNGLVGTFTHSTNALTKFLYYLN